MFRICAPPIIAPEPDRVWTQGKESALRYLSMHCAGAKVVQ